MSSVAGRYHLWSAVLTNDTAGQWVRFYTLRKLPRANVVYLFDRPQTAQQKTTIFSSW